MFRNVHDLGFEVDHRVDGGDVCYLAWQSAGRAKLIEEIDFAGVSVGTLRVLERIASHVDY